MSGQHSISSNSILEKLVKALDEAWTKVHLALDQNTADSKQFELRVHLAAEAVEYSSFLFSLTYNLEDFDPEVKFNKKQEPLTLVKDSIKPLNSARDLRDKSPLQAYSSLRTAAEYLQVAYLNQVKKRSKEQK